MHTYILTYICNLLLMGQTTRIDLEGIYLQGISIRCLIKVIVSLDYFLPQELKVLHAADINDEYKLKHIAYIQDMRNELEQEDLIKNINSLSSGGLYAYDQVCTVHCDHVICTWIT